MSSLRAIHAETVRHFLLPIVPFLDDPDVTEVMINGPFEIFVERAGRIEATSARFEDQFALEAGVRHLAQMLGRTVGPAQPILEGRLPDGSRVEAVIPPASPDGPHVSIRRFLPTALTIPGLVDAGALSAEVAEFLACAVSGKRNVVVAGGTGAGKTSLVSALAGCFSPSERVVVIEDARELQIPGDHVVHLEAQPPGPDGRCGVSIRALFRATLRLRPDRIIVGEIRSGEAIDLIQAMTSGHGGCLTTVHASHPCDAARRLETMALMSDVDLPLAALRAQIASAVDLVVQIDRLPDGGRAITAISEVCGLSPSGDYQLRELFARIAEPGRPLELVRVDGYRSNDHRGGGYQ